MDRPARLSVLNICVVFFENSPRDMLLIGSSWPTGGHLRQSGVIGGETVWVMSPCGAQGFVFAFRGFYLG